MKDDIMPPIHRQFRIELLKLIRDKGIHPDDVIEMLKDEIEYINSIAREESNDEQ